MSRLQVLLAQPRLALGALVSLALATAAVAGSGADFTAASANPANTFATGTLAMVNSKAGAAILTAADLEPSGAAATGDVDIQNSGSLSGTFTLVRGAISDSDAAHPLSAKLNVSVTDCGLFAAATPPACGDGDDVTKYAGTLADMGTAGHAVSSMGDFAGADKRRYRFAVSLDGSADDAYQGGTASVELNWVAN
jgi:hypothetical protein